MTYDEAEVRPFVQEIAVHVDTVGFGQIFGYQLPDRG